MNLNLDFTGATLLKNWWKTVKENFSSIQENFNSHNTNTVLDHPNGSVTTSKLASRAVTKAKLSADIVNQLDVFEEHINNPSQEIADGTIIKTKLSEEERSGYEKSVMTSEFINNLYGCRDFLWTKNEMVLTDENFPNEFEIHDYDQVINEKFTEDVWYLYDHDGTFSIISFNYFENDDSDETYFSLGGRQISQKGIYALKFHTDTPAASGSISSGTCTFIKIAEGSFEDMISGKNISDGAVTEEKLADGAVTKEKLSQDVQDAFNSINDDSMEIEDGAVITSKIADGAVTDAKLSSDLKAKTDALTEDAVYLIESVSANPDFFRYEFGIDVGVKWFSAGYDGGFVTLEKVDQLDLSDEYTDFASIEEMAQAIRTLEAKVNELSA